MGDVSEDMTSRMLAKKKKLPRSPQSVASVLSGMENLSNEVQEQEVKKEEVVNDDEISEDGVKTSQAQLLAPLDRSKYGKYVLSYGPGKTFGEVALVHKDTVRNASVITDEETDLMVIDHDLFDRSLRREQEEKYAEIRDFIEEHPFFREMNIKLKKMLEMSIRKERYMFDTNIIRQGDPVIGLHFMLSGSANISIQPKKHQTQYAHLWPFEAGVDQIAIEFEHLREARRAAILRKYEDPAVWETKPEELVIRREQGYAAIEKKMKENHINLCSVQTREVLGDLETLLNLDTYVQTVRCTSDTQCFILDTKNFERLVGKKSLPNTMDKIREYVKSKLHTRMQMRNAELIPLLGYLYQKLTEQSLPERKKVEPFKTSKTLPDVDQEMQHLLQYFREGKEVVLLKPLIPGIIYYRELMHEKAKTREQQRLANKSTDSITLGAVRANRPRRNPRSMLQIRESLKQMMDAEVIEMKSQKFHQKKFKVKRSAKRVKLSDRSNHMDTPRTQVAIDTEMKESRPGFITAIKAAAQKRDAATNAFSDTENTNERSVEMKLASNPNLPKSTPPVFVTEISKHQSDNKLQQSDNKLQQSDNKLPVITEENTQEEILLLKTIHNNGVTKDLLKSENESCDVTDAKQITEGKNKHESNSVLSSIISAQALINSDSAHEHMHVNAIESIPKLPNISGSETSLDKLHPDGGEISGRTDESHSTSSSKWHTAITFVNHRVQDRLTKALMEEETVYKDFETSEPTLNMLENRIQAFHIKYGMGNKTKNLPPLKRYKQDMEEELRPKPGGKVWVRRQACKFASSEYKIKDHKHERYQMVNCIPQFDKVKRQKVIVQQLMKTAEVGRIDTV